nr:PREDICTED: uncharacterized protein LOC109439279 isoform X1 [Rhinolophus sinicus]XP_019575102.1 PREDICTED: uncharacterized protein LOC109439279 isoform X2 [Rhinolophus sinicus]
MCAWQAGLSRLRREDTRRLVLGARPPGLTHGRPARRVTRAMMKTPASHTARSSAAGAATPTSRKPSCALGLRHNAAAPQLHQQQSLRVNPRRVFMATPGPGRRRALHGISLGGAPRCSRREWRGRGTCVRSLLEGHPGIPGPRSMSRRPEAGGWAVPTRRRGQLHVHGSHGGWPLSSPQEAAPEQGDRVEPGSGGCVPCAQRVLAPGGGAVSVLRGRGQQRRQLGQTRSEGHCRAGHDSLGAQRVQAPGSPGRTGGQQTRQWGSSRSQRSTDKPGCRRLSHLKDCPHHLPLRPLSPLCPHSATRICDPPKATCRVHTQTSWG